MNNKLTLLIKSGVKSNLHPDRIYYLTSEGKILDITPALINNEDYYVIDRSKEINTLERLLEEKNLFTLRELNSYERGESCD